MKRLALVVLVSVAVVGCGKKHAVVAKSTPPPPPPAAASTPVKTTSKTTPNVPAPALDQAINELYGYASWYGHPYHGRKTASGEVYDMYQMTAAHKTLPLGTVLEVTNQTNGKQVEVRINDRGPFIEGRVIDLSFAAAKEIQIVGPGIALVSLKPLNLADARFGVQVGTFREHDNAVRLRERIARNHKPVAIAPEGELYRVLVGEELSEASAQTLAAQLKRENIYGKVVMLP